MQACSQCTRCQSWKVVVLLFIVDVCDYDLLFMLKLPGWYLKRPFQKSDAFCFGILLLQLQAR